MYNYTNIKTIHLEVTSRCQASCPMCARNIQGGVDNPFMTVTEITLDQFKEWFPVDFIQRLDKLYMCGNLGDPAVAKDTLKIFEYLRTINPSLELSMNTNGSARNVQFWKGLAETNVHVRFGIDGLAGTHELYRVGTDWAKIIDNAKHFIKAGGSATWDMLIFEHNKHQVDFCKELSDLLGFKQFVAKNTARFKDDYLNVLDKQGKTTHILYPTDRSKQIKVKDEPTVITCKALDEQSLYISATGNITLCCWLDNEWQPPHNPSRVDYMDKIGRRINLNTHQLSDVDTLITDIKNTWSASPLKECAKQCGKVDRFNEQFK